MEYAREKIQATFVQTPTQMIDIFFQWLMNESAG